MLPKVNLICRTCLEMGKTYFNMFEHREREKLLSELLRECIPMKVEKSAGLPSHMCSNCTEKLCVIWDFKSMVMVSNLKLQMRRGITLALMPTPNTDKGHESGSEDSKNIISEYIIKEEISAENIDVASSSSVVEVNSANREMEMPIAEHNYNMREVVEHIDLSKTIIECDRNSSDEGDNFASTNDTSEKPQIDSVNNETIIISKESNVEIKKVKKVTTKKKNVRGKTNSKVSKAEAKKLTLFDNEFDDCDSVLKTEQKLTRKGKHKTTVFCKQCNRSMEWRYYNSVHVKYHKGDKPYKCDVCEKAFVLRFQLKIHQKLHEEEREFSCDICGKRFKQPSAVYNHRVIHSEERPHKCHVCNKGFKHSHALSKHIRIHTKEKLFICEICGKSCLDHSSFLSHKSRHDVVEKPCPCSICGKVFANSIRLKIHEKKTHSEVKPHVCTYCGKAFKESQTLKIHTLVHTGEKPHSCNVCGKKFRQLACLPKHMRIHTGETPFSCELCPSKFKYKHHLQNHMKSHKSS
ncbi:zinc finger and scan domain-containing [Holotrichia oblita]|uniref:Zinc finger and scan domain-containing n=1 Tax=Holotrichia oblita TaxID=644536 RepID=A0ACB9SJ49_HOLOL|nr:zinc finger and scan domain-containing [Holotrichia oblita]